MTFDLSPRFPRTPEPELVAEMSGLIPSDNSTVSVSRRWQPRKKRIGGSACLRIGDREKRIGETTCRRAETKSRRRLSPRVCLSQNCSDPRYLTCPSFPLVIALMRNQISAAERMGVRAATINSDNVNEWANVEERIQNDAVDILLISPERLGNQRFVSEVLGPIAERIGLLVIDEAHCISDWGHDFRPHYRLIARVIGNLPSNFGLLATTATANDRVVKDLQTVLGPNLFIVRGDLSRPSLFLQNIHLPSQAERMAWIAGHLADLSGSGIIYTLTIRDAEQLAGWLKSRNLKVEAYTSETGERREEFERALLENRLKALVATMALGMGFDKPDLAFVIHYQTPGSVVAYYQQVGRAGRAFPAAYGILLSGREETEITDYFIESAFPTREAVSEVIQALGDASVGLSVQELLRRVNLSKGCIEKTIQLLSLESLAPIVKEGTKWVLTIAGLGDSFWERAERLTQLRRNEQSQMQEYAAMREGLMEFLIRALDGETAIVNSHLLPALPELISPDLVQAANTFLRRSYLPIKPRAMWPAGGLANLQVTGKIAEAFRAEEGRVLCLWADAGWGELVRNGKQVSGRFSDELVDATVSDPFFLVNDMVDSGWTLTVAVYQLRKAGSGSAYPLALASTSNQ